MVDWIESSEVLVGDNQDEYACLHLFFNAGMKDDSIQGLAHLSEHIVEMCYGNDFKSVVECNAFVTKEYTCFFSKTLKKSLHEVLRSQEKLIDNTIQWISDELITREKKRIIEENRRALENERLCNLLRVEELVFEDNPLGRTTFIIPETFLKISKNEIVDFIKKRYTIHPCLVYSGQLTDMGDRYLIKSNKSKTEIGEIEKKSISYKNIHCISINKLRNSFDYLKLQILMEYYEKEWNAISDNKIVSKALKLFDTSVLLLFEFKEEIDNMFENYLSSTGPCEKTKDRMLSAKETVLLRALCKYHDLSAMNLLLYKMYRYFGDVDFAYKKINKLVLMIEERDLVEADAIYIKQSSIK